MMPFMSCSPEIHKREILMDNRDKPDRDCLRGRLDSLEYSQLGFRRRQRPPAPVPLAGRHISDTCSGHISRRSV